MRDRLHLAPPPPRLKRNRAVFSGNDCTCASPCFNWTPVEKRLEEKNRLIDHLSGNIQGGDAQHCLSDASVNEAASEIMKRSSSAINHDYYAGTVARIF